MIRLPAFLRRDPAPRRRVLPMDPREQEVLDELRRRREQGEARHG